jgi:hemerythrin-like domain-containing protein
MYTATNNLENDHVQILRLTDIMEQITILDEPQLAHLEEVVDLIRNFADGMHHLKEENHLFPLLGEKGLPKEQGPVAVMLHEHEQGREYVRGMVESIKGFQAGDPAKKEVIYKNMLGYADLLRAHIHKENNILFRMADGLFTKDDQHHLLNEFSKIENPELGDKHQTYFARIERLAGIYL